MTWWRPSGREDDPAGGPADPAGALDGEYDPAYRCVAVHLVRRALGRDEVRAETDWLGAQGPTVWRRLDSDARDPSGYRRSYPPEAILRSALTADCSTLLAVVASFHVSGYVRDRAVEILGTRAEPASSKALVLRCSDWVDAVRARSWAAILSRVDRESALATVPFLVATVDQDRSRGLLQQYVARIPNDAVGELLRLGTRPTRRLLVDRIELADAELLRAAIEDEDQVVRHRSAATLLARHPGAASELLDRGSGLVVALAIDAASDGQVLQRADRLLLDRRLAVRGAIQRRLTRLGVDVFRRYSALVDGPSPKPWGVVGLGEAGGSRAAERIALLARHSDERVRRAAILASQWSFSGRELVALCVMALHDDSERVVHAGARVLWRRGSSVPRQVVLDAVASPSRATRHAGLRLARRSDDWTRLEVDLLLGADADVDLACEGRADLTKWGAAGLHGHPSREQRDTILRLVEDAGLNEATKEWVRFCCGRRSKASDRPGLGGAARRFPGRRDG